MLRTSAAEAKPFFTSNKQSTHDALQSGGFFSGLPPFTYFSSNAKRIGEGPYVYARNLLANRLYKAPVVFLEPYVMNSSPVWKRVQMGDYRGLKSVDGESVPSLMSEYASGVAQGLVRYYSTQREIK